jgi:hypothetical protein
VRAIYLAAILAAILAQRRPERLLIKLDIEGEQIRVIPTLFDVLHTFFETHRGQADWDWVSQQLSEHGFVVERQRSLGDYPNALFVLLPALRFLCEYPERTNEVRFQTPFTGFSSEPCAAA